MQLIAAALLACGCASLAEVADWPPADEYVAKASCSQSASPQDCEHIRVDWAQTYGNAIGGSYESQRIVALCLSTGCNEGIVANPILGCAWRHVIAASRHPQLNDGDRADFRYFCGPKLLDDAGRQAAGAQSGTWLILLGVTQ